MKRAVKIFITDTYETTHVRQAFFDSSCVLPPVQLEVCLGSIDGSYHGLACFAFCWYWYDSGQVLHADRDSRPGPRPLADVPRTEKSSWRYLTDES